MNSDELTLPSSPPASSRHFDVLILSSPSRTLAQSLLQLSGHPYQETQPRFFYQDSQDSQTRVIDDSTHGSDCIDDNELSDLPQSLPDDAYSQFQTQLPPSSDTPEPEPELPTETQVIALSNRDPAEEAIQRDSNDNNTSYMLTRRRARALSNKGVEATTPAKRTRRKSVTFTLPPDHIDSDTVVPPTGGTAAQMPPKKAPETAPKGTARTAVNANKRKERAADKATKLAVARAAEVAADKGPKPAGKPTSKRAPKPPPPSSDIDVPSDDYGVVQSPAEEATSQLSQDSQPQSTPVPSSSAKRHKSTPTPPEQYSVLTTYRVSFNGQKLKDFSCIYTGERIQIQDLVNKARGLAAEHAQRQGLRKRLVERTALLEARRHGKQAVNVPIDYDEDSTTLSFMASLSPYIKHFAGFHLTLLMTEHWHNVAPNGAATAAIPVEFDSDKLTPLDDEDTPKGRRLANDRTKEAFNVHKDTFAKLMNMHKCQDRFCSVGSNKTATFVGCMVFRGQHFGVNSKTLSDWSNCIEANTATIDAMPLHLIETVFQMNEDSVRGKKKVVADQLTQQQQQPLQPPPPYQYYYPPPPPPSMPLPAAAVSQRSSPPGPKEELDRVENVEGYCAWLSNRHPSMKTILTEVVAAALLDDFWTLDMLKEEPDERLERIVRQRGIRKQLQDKDNIKKYLRLLEAMQEVRG